jgi:hypothetical protein
VPGTGFRPNGSLTLARDDAELGLLNEAAARPDAGLRDYELLDPAAIRAVNPALRGEFAGGLLCRADAIVEPRQVPLALRAHLLDGAPGQPPPACGPAGPHPHPDGTDGGIVAVLLDQEMTASWRAVAFPMKGAGMAREQLVPKAAGYGRDTVPGPRSGSGDRPMGSSARGV